MRCESVERVMLHGDVEWWGEWRMVTVSLIICNLATRVRWSFSEFKMSHYIDCLVFRSDGDTDAEVWRCVGRHLCVRGCVSSRHQHHGDTGADVTTWFLPPTSSCSVEKAPAIWTSIYIIIHNVRKMPAWHRLHVERAQ